MFHVKICGVMTAADARLAVEAGADAIGINFVPGSPRCLSTEAGREVAMAVEGQALVVGVFAGTIPAEMRRVAEAVGLDAIQLHGHLAGDGAVDQPESCAAVAPLPVIRAVRLGVTGFDETRRWIAEARAAGAGPVMAVVDAAVPSSATAGHLGGTGDTVDWSRLVEAGDLGIPLALAGGLTPANVAAAIRATGAKAVDTASGVEIAPGRKDPEKMRAFCAEARRAFAAAAG
ncbi:MAG: phosphoribosylanthranilate isomerase [Planctomycetia bacterium]|nr:phosphoribosylanthranilate isomerase [Planctomycetia bacterium]